MRKFHVSYQYKAGVEHGWGDAVIDGDAPSDEPELQRIKQLIADQLPFANPGIVIIAWNIMQ